MGCLGLIDADYCLWNGLAMRFCCVALGTMSGHLWWSMIMWEKSMYTCICNWVTTLYSRKLTEPCKPAIMEKIKFIILKNKNKYIKLMGKCLVILSRIKDLSCYNGKTKQNKNNKKKQITRYGLKTD